MNESIDSTNGPKTPFLHCFFEMGDGGSLAFSLPLGVSLSGPVFAPRWTMLMTYIGNNLAFVTVQNAVEASKPWQVMKLARASSGMSA